MAKSHCIVWIDREHARIYHLSDPKLTQELTFEKPDHHTHAKEGESAQAPKFYHEVAQLLKGEGAILVVGPGVGKAQFKHHLEEHDPDIAKRVVAYENADHPTDGQLRDHAQQYFSQPMMWGR